MIKFEFLGTGSSSLVPVYNCHCVACDRARTQVQYQRRPCSALLSVDQGKYQGKWLIDSGLTDLRQRFSPGELKAILQTHYHADHAQGLLQLRWGEGLKIPVYGPVDEIGFADLYKNAGVLDFQKGFEPFDSQHFGAFSVMAIPLQHSKPTVGYLISSLNGENLAYLTDTCGLSDEVMQFLGAIPIKYLVVDCSYPPLEKPRNHNDLTMAIEICEQLGAEQSFITHIDHKLDAYLINNPDVLPECISVARDGLSVNLL